MFFSEWRIKYRNLTESETVASVMICSCGEEYCRHDKKKVECLNSSPYSLHFIIYGKGTLVFGEGEEVQLGRGNMFLLYEGQNYRYFPDENSPWAYAWVNFKGQNIPELLSMCGFSKEKPFIRTKYFDMILPAFKEITETYYDNENMPATCLASFMKIISILEEENKKSAASTGNKQKGKSVNRIIMYINDNIKLKLTIPAISLAVMLSESYIKTLFSEAIGMSVTEYINRYRVSLACLLLKEKRKMDVCGISEEVGYDSVTYFVRIFKKYKQISPLQYRKNVTEDDPFKWFKEKKLDII